MTHPANRLITLIMLLQRQPNQKAAGLAQALGVSVRTLHRYFAMLDEMGIPVYTERGPHGGFSLVRGYKMPPLVFSPEEATALYLGATLIEQMWGRLYHEAAQGALAKLDNVLPDEQRQEIAWAQRSLVATGLHRADLEPLIPLLEKLRRAVRETRRVEMLYRSASGAGQPPAAKPTTIRPTTEKLSPDAHPLARQVDPYALVYRWGWWYMVGFCHLRQEVRSFRIDRILELTLSDQVFQAPAGFSIQAYLAEEMQLQPKLRVHIRFSPQAAQVALANRSNWETLEQQPDGTVVVTFLAPDLNWAASSILAYGPLVTVLEPVALTEIVKEWAQAISGLYQPDLNSGG